MASARPVATPFIPVGATIDAPRGFTDMCRTDADFCTPSNLPPTPGNAMMVTAALASDGATPPASGPIIDVSPLTDGDAPFALPSLSIIATRPDTPLLQLGPDPRMAENDASKVPATHWAALSTPLLDRVAAANVSELGTDVANTEATGTAPTHNELQDRAELALLRHVDHYVNDHVLQRTDLKVYGRDEFWTRSGVGRGARGDCEDIAIEKRYELIAAGFPADRLFFGIVYATRVGLHTVLVAHLDSGDMVLDSRSYSVLPWNQTPYSWIGVQSTVDEKMWRQVTPVSHTV
jgi:predicted transglutaminase-like cysteine proteinase